VAALALAPKAAAMNVHIVVAARTAAGQAERSVHGSAMTGEAIKSSMPAIEFEGRSPVVVELPAFPVDRVVAGFAFGPEAQLVRVVLPMTGHAFNLGIPEGRCDMTFLALDLGVFAKQWKPRESVVHTRVLPTAFVMTTRTLLSLLPFVLVILAMAREAVGPELLPIENSRMTQLALCLGMLSA